MTHTPTCPSFLRTCKVPASSVSGKSLSPFQPLVLTEWTLSVYVRKDRGSPGDSLFRWSPWKPASSMACLWSSKGLENLNMSRSTSLRGSRVSVNSRLPRLFLLNNNSLPSYLSILQCGLHRNQRWFIGASRCPEMLQDMGFHFGPAKGPCSTRKGSMPCPFPFGTIDI